MSPNPATVLTQGSSGNRPVPPVLTMATARMTPATPRAMVAMATATINGWHLPSALVNQGSNR